MTYLQEVWHFILTLTEEAIAMKCVPFIAVTVEAALSVVATLVTTTISIQALIHICTTHTHSEYTSTVCTCKANHCSCSGLGLE